MKKIILNLAIIFLINFSLSAQLTYTISDEIGIQNVVLDVTVDNFEDILSSQFSIQWDDQVAVLDSVGGFNLPNLNNANFGYQFVNEGILTHSWFDSSLQGVTVPDGTVIFRLYFHTLNEGSSPVSINGAFTAIEFTEYDDTGTDISEIFDYTLNPGSINGAPGSLLTGYIFKEENTNCSYGPADAPLSGWNASLTNGTETYYATSGENGTYAFFVLPDNYTLSVTPPNDLWSLCQDSYNLDLTDTDVDVIQDVGVEAQYLCPAMSVDLSTPFLRRCFDNNYHINYCNLGTVDGLDSYVEVELDPDFTIISTSIPYTLDGGIATFDIGDVAIGECGTFGITAYLACDEVEPGETHCSSAYVYPDEICGPTSGSWSGASLEVEADCIDDNVNFTIKNIGDAMMQESQYIVIEDNVMMMPSSINPLNADESIQVPLPANGSTYRIEVEQVEGHPGNSSPTIAIEGCGTNDEGEFSTGFVLQFEEDEADSFVAIDCQENIGSYDPNDKQGFPVGFGEEHKIRPNTDIEYMIRFQNTGTDTAFTVVIRDEISPLLDITKIVPGASSHSYDFATYGEGEIIFTFNDIMLPDSNVNLVGSNGFVKFSIPQQFDNPIGSVIENEAAIFFDFNDPVITNKTFHTVAIDFGTVTTSYFNTDFEEIKISTYPNPFVESCTFELKGKVSDVFVINIYDQSGKLIKQGQFNENKYTLGKNGLTTGSYFYTINSGNNKVQSGQIMLH